MSPILNHFSYAHLPQHLQDVSAHMHDLAIWLDKILEDNEAKQIGLRKLLEAQDWLVHSQVETTARAKQAKQIRLEEEQHGPYDGPYKAKQTVNQKKYDEKIRGSGPTPGIYKGGTC